MATFGERMYAKLFFLVSRFQKFIERIKLHLLNKIINFKIINFIYFCCRRIYYEIIKCQ